MMERSSGLGCVEPEALRIREAGAGDVEAVVALVNSAYRGESGQLGWTTEADLLDGQRTDAEEVSRLIAAPDSVLLLYFSGAFLVGNVYLENTEKTVYLGMFAIRPLWQGKGLGKRFLEAAELFARSAWHARRISLTVIRARQELIAFYERRGYRRSGVLEPFPDDPRYGIPKMADLRLEVMEKTWP